MCVSDGVCDLVRTIDYRSISAQPLSVLLLVLLLGVLIICMLERMVILSLDLVLSVLLANMLSLL